MNPSGTLAFVVVSYLRLVATTVAMEDVERIRARGSRLCEVLAKYHAKACELTASADKVLLTGEDLVKQLQEERLEMFVESLSQLVESIKAVTREMSATKGEMSLWWQTLGEIVLRWQYLAELHPFALASKDWHTQALDAVYQNLTASTDGFEKIKESFCRSPAFMTRVVLGGTDSFAQMRDLLSYNEAMAKGWLEAFETERVSLEI